MDVYFEFPCKNAIVILRWKYNCSVKTFGIRASVLVQTNCWPTQQPEGRRLQFHQSDVRENRHGGKGGKKYVYIMDKCICVREMRTGIRFLDVFVTSLYNHQTPFRKTAQQFHPNITIILTAASFLPSSCPNTEMPILAVASCKA